MSEKRFLTAMLIGVAFGFLAGAFLPKIALALSFIGELFLNALKMVVLPLIVVSIANSVLGMETIENFKKLGIKTLLYYFFTTSFAVAVGITVVLLVRPGEGFSVLQTKEFSKQVNFSLHDLITGLIPQNIFKALVEFDVLPVIVATVLFSLAVLSIDWKRETVVHRVISELDVIFLKLTGWIISFAPLGIFSLIAAKVASMGGKSAIGEIFLSLGKYVLTVISGLAIHGFIVLPLIYFLLVRKNPYSYISKVKEALLTAFATASSSATLPVTLKNVTSSGVNRPVAEFVLPLGATVNMDGTALYEAVAAIFLAQSYGIELSTSQVLVIFLTATLAAIGAAGIPEAGLVTMVLVLQSVGIPVEGIGLILAVDWFLDRCRTAVNVLGDTIGAAILSKGIKGGTGEIRIPA